MEITKSTFAEKLSEIKGAIDEATFLSIDCELSGLNTSFDINAYDTPKQYFEKVHSSSRDFLVIQYGLSAFRYDKTIKGFKHKTFNFFIFPRRLNRMVPDHRFMCQTSSIDFLISQGFDFNKLFKEGIPYLNTQSESRYKEVLQEGRNARAKLYLSPQTLSTISVPEEEKPFIDKVFKEIEAFIASNEEEHFLPKCNAFVRRLIYQTANGRIDNRASLETRQVENNDRILVVTRPKSIRDREQDEVVKKQEETETLKAAIGFSEVMQYISKSRKLLVGHNVLLDLCHSIDKFLTALPENYETFKECANFLFPNVLDTKYMSSFGPFKELVSSTTLAALLSTLKESPFGLPHLEAESDDSCYSFDSPKEHEAGYDAFITGVCFASMWKYLGQQANSQNAFEDFNLVKPYINRLFLMRIQDGPYIQLDGEDPKPSREHVFYLTFPKDWKLNDIVQLFSPFGNIYVAWIDDCSAFVALHRRDQCKVALSTLSQSDTYRIMTYAQSQAQLATNNDRQNDAGHKSKKKRNDSWPPIKKRKTSSSNDEAAPKRKSNEVTVEVSPQRMDSTDGDNKRQQQSESGESTVVPCLIKPRKRTISKTFTEDNSWE